MAKYLVIVESPAKAKTIKKFLGSNYQVIASNGHVRDLPKSTLGIDVDNDFEPLGSCSHPSFGEFDALLFSEHIALAR